MRVTQRKIRFYDDSDARREGDLTTLHPRKVFVPEEDHLPVPIHDDRRIAFDFDSRFFDKDNQRRPVRFHHTKSDGINLKPRYGSRTPEFEKIDHEMDPMAERVKRDMTRMYDVQT